MNDDDHQFEFADVPSESEYVCPACGEVIVVPLDISAGPIQDYVEDCPICCRPNQLSIVVSPDGSVRMSCESE